MTERPRILGALLADTVGFDPEILEAALGPERRDRERVGQTLIRLGAVTDEHVARALATQLGLGFRAGPLDPSDEALELVDSDFCASRGLVPLT